MMSQTILWTIAVLVGIGLLAALLLWLLAKKFKVEEDPRIDLVEKEMPGANCGGCGFAGCRAFAQSCVEKGNLDTNFCPVGGNDTMKKVAQVLGIEVAERQPMVAVVRCNGNCDARPNTNEWDGAKSCKIIANYYNGQTDCPYGCLGCGDCVEACAFGALSMNPQTGLPEVDEDKCTSCGACVKSCPKGIIELRNKGFRGRRIWVDCVNKDKGAVARKACTNACIGCGKCAKACVHGAITISDNLAYIDYNKCKLCKKCITECPTGSIHSINFPVVAKKEIQDHE